jgi:hypothetical protein
MSKKRRVLEPKLQSVLLLMRRSGSRTGLTEAGRRGPLLPYPSLSTSHMRAVEPIYYTTPMQVTVVLRRG